jgi:hypothetical protein
MCSSSNGYKIVFKSFYSMNMVTLTGFSLCTLKAEALYPFIYLDCIEVPTSIKVLPRFLSQLDTCKQIVNTYDRFCVRCTNNESIHSQRRPSLTSSQITNVLHELNSDASPSIFLTSSM